MTSYRSQNGQRLLVQLEKLLQLHKRLFILTAGNMVCHVIHHRIQHGLSDGVDITFLDLICAGIGRDLGDLAADGGHSSAGDLNEIQTQIRGDSFLVRSKVAADPGHQVPLTLLGKLNDLGVVADDRVQFPCLLHRIPWGDLIGKDHCAVVGNVRQCPG